MGKWTWNNSLSSSSCMTAKSMVTFSIWLNFFILPPDISTPTPLKTTVWVKQCPTDSSKTIWLGSPKEREVQRLFRKGQRWLGSRACVILTEQQANTHFPCFSFFSKALSSEAQLYVSTQWRPSEPPLMGPLPTKKVLTTAGWSIKAGSHIHVQGRWVCYREIQHV